jgi:3-oxoadipate enol-lactonase
VGADSIHYCGESLGGILGMVFAATRPQRVRTLSLIFAPVFLDDSFKDRSRFGYASWEEALRKLGAQGYANNILIKSVMANGIKIRRGERT